MYIKLLYSILRITRIYFKLLRHKCCRRSFVTSTSLIFYAVSLIQTGFAKNVSKQKLYGAHCNPKLKRGRENERASENRLPGR